MTGFRASLLPVLSILTLLLALWYAALIPMNRIVADPFIAQTDGSFAETFRISGALERPVLPSAHQVFNELKKSIFDTPLTREVEGVRTLNNRNLLFHVWTTLSSTLLGFVFGTLLGILLAIGIVHVNALRMSLMPWIIASQTIPILAIAPIVIVGLGAVGIVGLIPKSIISAYLSFFPVTIGMVKGLTSPDTMQLDLMRTYNASKAETFWKLRLPASVPFLFAHRRAGGHRRTAAHRQLLRPDGADLGGLVRRSDYRRAAGLWHRRAGEADGPLDGRARMNFGRASALLFPLVTVILAIGLLRTAHEAPGGATTLFWVYAAVFWLLAWRANSNLAALTLTGPLDTLRRFSVPAIFGITILILWEIICVGGGVPTVLMPAPSLIGSKFFGEIPTLSADFVQTVLKAVIPGWAIGSGLGVLVAVACDRVDFLRRGLLPLGNFVAALPIVGIAPIMVMWFGFDWQSKMAVVIIMTFFPALVNAVVGLAASGHLERDLMKSYGASSFQTLVRLKLPVAMPFIFNALKINATLALIGAIVAEFFGTPIVGMGFRISASLGQMSLDMVWAEILVAALTGSAFYGLLAAIERIVTFWHPSYRAKTA
jgi:NitT/TauT family transport system permease protein